MVRLLFIQALFVILIMNTGGIKAQIPLYNYEPFSEADSLRGTLGPKRTCFDVSHYALDIEVDIKNKSISGSNTMSFIMAQESDEIQIDLFENMIIDSIIWQSKKLPFTRKYNAVFIRSNDFQKGQTHSIQIIYHGIPTEAKNAPWDGGFVWTSDHKARPWVGVACEGTGASLWWPNKDHLSDEPDSMDVIVSVDKDLECISNGVLVDKQTNGDKNIFHWKVSYPINNYNISLNIGHYVHFQNAYKSDSKDDLLSCNYYVLDYNLDKAKEHFKQVYGVLEAFEYYLAPYPFWRDGYALIETPYLGMEHQSGIAYGNNFMRGYLGARIPFDMNWDYIIVHETGHEWWGNSVSVKDHAEMWIHESFTTYMEALYVEYHFGYSDMIRYLKGQRRHVNKTPIVGPLGVNYSDWAGSDEYFKGSWIIHSFRHILGDDVFFPFLKAFYLHHTYQTITTREFMDFVKEFTGADFDHFFTQYLYTPDIPRLLYSLEEKDNGVLFKYKWDGCIAGFIMPIQLNIENIKQHVSCSEEWSESFFEGINKKDIEILDELMLIDMKRIRP